MKKIYYDSFSGLVEVKVDSVVKDNIYLRAQVDQFPYKAGELIFAQSFNRLVYKRGLDHNGHTMLVDADMEAHLPCA